jgi:putative tricarboxylic transport membrane protein
MSLRDPIAAVIVFAFAGTIFVMAGSFDPAAALFPRAVAAIMMAAAVAMGVRPFLIRMEQPLETIDRGSMLRVGMVIGLTFIYVIGVAWLGYATASVVFIPVTAWLLGIRNISLIAATTIVYVGIITFLFRQVFSIPLPREVLLGLFS